MILDSELNFYSHVKEKIVSARKAIGVIRFMSRYVTREVLDQMYKLYVRPHLDSGDIIHDINGIKLTRLRVIEFRTYVAIVSGTILTVQAHCVCVRLESRIMNITSYTARDLHISVESCLTWSPE